MLIKNVPGSRDVYYLCLLSILLLILTASATIEVPAGYKILPNNVTQLFLMAARIYSRNSQLRDRPIPGLTSQQWLATTKAPGLEARLTERGV